MKVQLRSLSFTPLALVLMAAPCLAEEGQSTTNTTSLNGWAEWLKENIISASLQKQTFLLEIWQWIGLAILVFLALVLDRVTRLVVQRIVQRITRARGAETGKTTVGKFKRPLGLWAGAMFFQVFLRALALPEQPDDALVIATSLVLTFTGVWAVYGFVDILSDYLEARAKQSKNKFDDMLVPLLRRTFKIVVVIGGLIFLATKWSNDLWSIVAGLGLGSVALAFAARDSVENLFGTFTVLLDKPFEIGDWITMGDLDGDVESVGFRSTRVRTFYNSVITVPNRHFISGQVDNMGSRRYRRIKTTLALTYDTPPEKIEAFCEAVRELIRKQPHTRKDYFHVYLNGMGASSLDVMLYCFVEVPDWSMELAAKHRLYADILRVAAALEVEFAFPTQSLHVVRPEDLEHGNTPASNKAGQALGIEVATAVLKETL